MALGTQGEFVTKAKDPILEFAGWTALAEQLQEHGCTRAEATIMAQALMAQQNQDHAPESLSDLRRQARAFQWSKAALVIVTLLAFAIIVQLVQPQEPVSRLTVPLVFIVLALFGVWRSLRG